MPWVPVPWAQWWDSLGERHLALGAVLALGKVMRLALGGGSLGEWRLLVLVYH